MPGVRDLASMPGFANLSSEAKPLVFDQAASQDDVYQALSPEAQALVKAQVLGGGPTAPMPSSPPPGGPFMAGPSITRPDIAQRMAELEQNATPGSASDRVMRAMAGSLAAGGITGGVMSLPGIVGVLGRAAPVVSAGAEAAGQYGARQANVAMGTEAPGGTGDIASVGLPLAARIAGAVGKFGMTHMPGAQAAMHEEGAVMARALPEAMRPNPSSTALFQVAETYNPLIAPSNLTDTAIELLKAEQKLATGLKNPDLIRVTRGIIDLGKKNPDGVPLQDLYKNMKRVGALVGETEKAGGPLHGAYKNLYRSMYQDLEETTAEGFSGSAISEGGVEALTKAIKAARKEFATDDLKELIETSITPAQGTRDLESVRGATMLRKWETKLRKDERFAGSFTDDDKEAITQTFKDLQELPRLPPERGAAAGSAMFGARTGTAYFGTKWLTGDESLAALAGATAAGLPWLTSRLLVTGPGRELIHVLLKKGPLMSPEAVGAMTTFARVSGDLAPGEKPPASYMPISVINQSEEIPLDEKVRRAMAELGSPGQTGAIPEQTPITSEQLIPRPIQQ